MYCKKLVWILFFHLHHFRWSLGWLAIGGGSVLWGTGRTWACRLSRLWHLNDEGVHTNADRASGADSHMLGLIWFLTDCKLVFSVSSWWKSIVGKGPVTTGAHPVCCPRFWEGLATLELPGVSLVVGVVSSPIPGTQKSTRVTRRDRGWLGEEGWVKQAREVVNLEGKRKPRKMCDKFKVPEDVLGREPCKRLSEGVLV